MSDIEKKVSELHAKKHKIEKQAEDLAVGIQTAQNELAEVNREFLKVQGAIEALEELKE